MKKAISFDSECEWFSFTNLSSNDPDLTNKSKVFCITKDTRKQVELNGKREELEQNEVEYLGSVINSNREIDAENNQRNLNGIQLYY